MFSKDAQKRLIIANMSSAPKKRSTYKFERTKVYFSSLMERIVYFSISATILSMIK